MTEPVDLHVIDGGGAEPPDLDPPEIDREAWIGLGREFAQATSQASWAFADWLAAGDAAWGADAMREAAEATGNSPEKICNYLAAAMAYPPFRRRNGLAFSHHLEVARLPQAEAERILDTALDEGWSHRETRAAAREASDAGRLARLRRENAQLKRALRRAMIEPRERADQARARFDAERRIVRDALRRIQVTAEALAQAGSLDGLHGNARLGVARDIERIIDNLADDFEGIFKPMAASAEIIRGGGQ